MKSIKFGLAALAAAGLVACGGGGGGGSTTTNPTIQGRVIDGYIENALVCLDLNNNLACDPGEPSGRTDKEGRYSLNYMGSIDGLVVLAVVDTDSIDSDLGPIQKPFNLFTPAESADVVTPLTTMVATQMISQGLNSEQAQDAVRAALSIPAGQKVLGYDFVAARDEKTLAVAQVLAASLAEIKDQLNQSQEQALTPRQLALAAVSEVTNNVVPQVISSDGSSRVQITAGTRQSDLIKQIEKVAESVNIQGRIQQIVAGSRIDSNIADARQVFKEGFVVASQGSGDYIENGNRVGVQSGYTNALEAEYTIFDEAIDSAVRWMQKVYISSKDNWFFTFDDDDEEEDWVLINGQWEKEAGDILDRNNLVFDRNCLVIPYKSGATLADRFCLVEKDLSGELVSKYLKFSNSVSPTLVFPAGSKGYDVTYSVNEDLYKLWASTIWQGYNFTGIDYEMPQNNKPNLTLFIEELLKVNQWVGDNCNVGFRAKSFNPQTKKGVMQWAANPQESCSGGGQPNFTNAEETTFEILTVAGKELMLVNYANLYRQLNPGDGIGGKKLFGVITNTINLYYDSNDQRVFDPVSTDDLRKETVEVDGIYSGEFLPKGSSVTLTFNGDIGSSAQFVNRTLFDSALAAVGIKPYDYTIPEKE